MYIADRPLAPGRPGPSPELIGPAGWQRPGVRRLRPPALRWRHGARGPPAPADRDQAGVVPAADPALPGPPRLAAGQPVRADQPHRSPYRPATPSGGRG